MESHLKTSTKYLEELSIQLRNQGFTVYLGESRDIDVEHDGSLLCRINDLGNLGYFADKIAGKESILNRVCETTHSTREYMTLLEQAPPLTAEGLSEGYQLLAEFNGTVLAGHMTQHGAQFVTWEWVHNRTSLWQGHYYDGGSGGYLSAKRDFTVRSGLVPRSALFLLSFFRGNEIRTRRPQKLWHDISWEIPGWRALRGPRAACRVGKGGAAK